MFRSVLLLPVPKQRRLQWNKCQRRLMRFAGKNPGVAVGACIGTAGLIVLVAPTVVSAPVLLATGFSSSGVGAGTIAAGAQGSIGNVAAGSVFATLQSAGAGGAGLAAVNGVAQVGGCAMAAAGSGLAFLKSKL
ncbi:uncharacterized protein K441DRAFT_678911 [Cenococcum geophilum 1.58]|uniref:uncharacterized protein n=1 Tax=Cenococcum geophilum 1.58 TaxID=794803 RepID=UPI00358ECB5B|nr:hypothetical protein K441DRAFT_678911 [Cenococcum geophilum 1.58]